MKRTILFLTLLLSSLGAFAQTFNDVDGLNYSVISSVDHTCKVASNRGASGDIIIPETVTYNDVTYSVTSIGEEAFDNCSGLTSVTIPNSVTTIGNYAFDRCRGLTSVTIPNSVTSIGDYAFRGCRGLTSVTIPNSVTSIGRYAFSGCSGLTSVTISNSVTTIGYYAFSGCDGLTSVTIPNSVTSIGERAFGQCSGLTSVTIPNSVTSIGRYAFVDCRGLTSVTIPNSVTSIGEGAFYWCSGLTSVTIPNSVTSIGTSAFNSVGVVKYCGSATGSPWGGTRVGCFYGEGDFIFENDTKTTILAYIGTGASVSIPNSVTYIEDYAFRGCSGLTSVTIPNSVTSIGEGAFYGCSGLTSVTIPNSVTSIGNSAFSGCSSLTSVTIPSSVTSIGEAAFQGCSGLTSVTIPNSVTNIGSSAFGYCSGLTGVTIPNSVTSIEDWAFGYCSGLTSVTIPNSVTSIGYDAFYGCSGLTNVTIGNSVTTIGSSAFSGCTQLATVYDYSNLPITRGSSNYGGVARYAIRVVKVLTDDRGNFNAPSSYNVDEVTYTRNYEQGNRSTLCLPFKPTAVSAQGLKFYKFTDFDGSTITYDEVAFEDLRANRPYMVEWPASAKSEFVFSATNATIPATPNSMDTTINGGSFIGTMSRTCMDGTNYYGYKNGYFVQSRGGQAEDAHAHVNPFRAYFEITPSSPEQGFSMPTELSVRFNTAEDNVGIDNVEPQQSNIRYSNDVYDMMGRMVRKNAESLDGLRKGVYIWKGEKKIVF